jgi:FixJ family two-component response regulator
MDRGQPAWSDFPFVLLTHRGGGVERNPAAVRLSGVLGNVGFLERPFHPATLVSAVRIALRGRLRQYEARERIEEIQRAEATLERRVEERTAELAAANKQLASQIVERERMEAALHQVPAAGGRRAVHLGRRARLQQPAHGGARQRAAFSSRTLVSQARSAASR